MGISDAQLMSNLLQTLQLMNYQQQNIIADPFLSGPNYNAFPFGGNLSTYAQPSIGGPLDWWMPAPTTQPTPAYYNAAPVNLSAIPPDFFANLFQAFNSPPASQNVTPSTTSATSAPTANKSAAVKSEMFSSVFQPTDAAPTARTAPVAQAAAVSAPVTLSATRSAATNTAVAASDSLTNPGDAPSQMGVHVHVKDLYGANNLINSKDLDMMQAAGVKSARFDVLWSDVEKKPGVFDFSRYDAVVDEMTKRGIKPIIILGFGNQHYPQEQKASMDGFERYSVATAEHFKDKGVIWELTNEPNSGQFWKPGPSADEYMSMVKSLAPKLRAADPSGQIIAGSTAGTDTDFLVKLFQQGLLDQVDAISVHPYQAFPNRAPENVKAELDKLRNAVDQYAPGRNFPIVLGEWGYSTAQGEIDPQTQADYLVRQSMLAQLNKSPLNIWYDWKGDIEGRNGQAEKEQQFGIVSADAQNTKPAYSAMQQMTRQLEGLHVDQRLKTGSPNDYLLLFTDGGNRSTVVAWTSDPAHTISVGGATVTLSGTPQYIPFESLRT
ncbi:MAG: cellulase family glycosylhydrolase [Vampirovibrionales bacterium]|nr:cellulase family glycosylhydrolase [Vampirovibrionales bacterium]